MVIRALRKLKRAVKAVVGSNPPPPPTPTPRPAPAQPMPSWMQPDNHQDQHGHSHDHDHDHGHSHDHANEHEPESAETKSDPSPVHLEEHAQSSNDSLKESLADIGPEIEIYASETPNPNALKFTLSERVAEQSFSATAGTESNNPVASAILAIPGVASVFGVNDFVTVTKSPDINSWDALSPAIEGALRKAIQGQK